MAKELTIRESYDVQKVKDMTAMSVVLKTHIVKHKLYTQIKGKNYAHVEGWQFAGGLMGLFPRIRSVENLSNDKEFKWRADVELVNKSGDVMGIGIAICSNKESIKKNFDEYAVLSMAQTRAIGKAYRNLIGWVMKLSGYEGTPSEEMRKVDEQVKEPTEEVPVIQREEKMEDHICVAKGCGKDITKQEAQYSKRVYGKELCREHQKEAKRK